MNQKEHWRAVERGVDITEKWYCICGYLNAIKDIDIEQCKIKIGEMEWDDEGMQHIYACKDEKRVWFVRNANNIDIQHQLQNMYIHGSDYTIKINEIIDKIHEKLLKDDEYVGFWNNIHCQFFNGTIEL